MPTYDYICNTCGETFEIFHSIKDDPLTDCPKEACHGNLKRKIGTGAGIIFKGSGFYETDYRSESYRKGAEAESKAGKEKSASGEGQGGGGAEKSGGSSKSAESSSSSGGTTSSGTSGKSGSSGSSDSQ
jgi:putative FmdB family regulatory protein